jgi:hypothetical protein
MQQIRFQLFITSPALILLTLVGVGALGWFAYLQSHHPVPLVRCMHCAKMVFQVGIVLYMFYY